MADLRAGSTIGGKQIEDTVSSQAKANKALSDAKDYTDTHIGKGGTAHAEATQSVAGFISAGDKTKLDNITANATKVEDSTTNGNIKINGTENVVYTHPSNHPATMITQDANNRFVSDTEKATWNDKYTKTEVDTKINTLTSNLDWKESVATFNDIVTMYPSPEDGWTVNVKDTDYTYRYNGTGWVAISANAIPLATQTVDGKMSKEDKTKLDGVTSGATKVEDSTTNGNIKINGVENVVYTHPSAHAATMITQDASNRFVSDTEKATWNGKLDSTANAVSASKLQTARSIGLSGDVSGSATFDGSTNVTITTTVADDSHAHTSATLPSASTAAKGIVQLTDATNSTSTTTAATPNAVKSAYDLANSKANASHTHGWTDITGVPSASTTVKGIVQLSYSTDNNSSTTAATSSAVKVVKDTLNANVIEERYDEVGLWGNTPSEVISDTTATYNITDIEGITASNLLPNFKYWTLHADARISSTNRYRIDLNASTTYKYSDITIKVRSNTRYYFKMKHNGTFYIYDNINAVFIINETSSQAVDFVTGTTSEIKIRVSNGNKTTGAFYFEYPMLSEADVEFVVGTAGVIGPSVEVLAPNVTPLTVTFGDMDLATTPIHDAHIYKRATYSIRESPNHAVWNTLSVTQDSINALKDIDSNVTSTSSSIGGRYAQSLFGFNLPAYFEKKFGIRPSSAWLNRNIEKIDIYWYGYGKGDRYGQSTHGAMLQVWNNSSSMWGTGVSHQSTTSDELSYWVSPSSTYSDSIDANGFMYVLASASHPAGTYSSEIHNDYIYIDITLVNNCELFVSQRKTINTSLHGIGSNKDKVYVSHDGSLKKRTLFKEVTLDGRHGWGLSSSNTNYKTVVAYGLLQGVDDKIAYTEAVAMSDFENKAVLYVESLNSGGQFGTSRTENKVWITIPDSVSGWGGYTPKPREIAAFFDGWVNTPAFLGGNIITPQLYHGEAYKISDTLVMNVVGAIYNTTTTAHTYFTEIGWVEDNQYKIEFRNGSTYFINLSGNPEFFSFTWDTLEKPEDFSYYKLVYKLKQPIIEDLGLDNRLTTFTTTPSLRMRTGIVERELVRPIHHYNSNVNNFYINALEIGMKNPFKYKVNKILKIYKNGQDDTFNWNFIVDQYSYGNERAYISADLYDPQANYSVTYEIIPHYTVKLNSMGVTYSTNLKSLVDENSRDLLKHDNKLGALSSMLSSMANKSGIVEKGENSNGSYVRFDNGVQICWHSTTMNQAAITWASRALASSTYYYRAERWIYPIKFKKGLKPSVFSSGDISLPAPETHTVFDANESYARGESGIYGVDPKSGASNAVVYKTYIAIGLWKDEGELVIEQGQG